MITIIINGATIFMRELTYIEYCLIGGIILYIDYRIIKKAFMLKKKKNG